MKNKQNSQKKKKKSGSVMDPLTICTYFFYFVLQLSKSTCNLFKVSKMNVIVAPELF